VDSLIGHILSFVLGDQFSISFQLPQVKLVCKRWRSLVFSILPNIPFIRRSDFLSFCTCSNFILSTNEFGMWKTKRTLPHKWELVFWGGFSECTLFSHVNQKAVVGVFRKSNSFYVPGRKTPKIRFGPKVVHRWDEEENSWKILTVPIRRDWSTVPLKMEDDILVIGTSPISKSSDMGLNWEVSFVDHRFTLQKDIPPLKNMEESDS